MATSEQARTLLSRHGVCVPQNAADWCGDVELPDDVRRFFAEVGPRNVEVVGYGNPTTLSSLALLWDRQAGYRWNGRTNERIADWPEHWFVIADEGADPYIFDAESRRVLFAHHGMGSWDADEVYPDLNTMAACIATLGSVIMDADEFTDDDCVIHPDCIDEAVRRLTELLASSSAAEAIVATAGWG